MILPALRWLVGAAQAAVELVSSGRRLVRDARRGLLPIDETEPIPLSSRDVEHIQEQIHQATTVRSSSRYDEIIPPPPTANSRPGSKLTRL